MSKIVSHKLIKNLIIFSAIVDFYRLRKILFI